MNHTWATHGSYLRRTNPVPRSLQVRVSPKAKPELEVAKVGGWYGEGRAEGLMGRESIRKRNTGWHLCATRLLLLATRHATSLLKADVPAYDNTSCGYATYIKTSEEDSHVIHAQHSPFSILAAKHFTKHIHLSKTVATWRAAPRKKKTAPAAFKNSHDEYASTPPRRSPGI